MTIAAPASTRPLPRLSLPPALCLALALGLPAAGPALARPAIAPQAAPLATQPSPEALKSMELRDSEGHPLGRVADILTDDAAADGVGHVLVSLGGFMGLGGHTVAVPYSEIRLRDDAKTGAAVAVIPWTEEQLRAVPAYNPADPATLGLVGAEAAGNDVGMTGQAQPPLDDPQPAPDPLAAQG